MQDNRPFRLASLAMVLAVLMGVLAPGVALAESDIMLGMFYTSDSDPTNSIYVSYDGTTLTRIATTYDTSEYDENGVGVFLDGYGNAHYGHVDPSIMYHNGKFWALSGWNRNDGLFWPMISYSSDLVHWTIPEGDMLLSEDSTHGVELAEAPAYMGGDFDTVAPEWYVGRDGSVYIVFSAGRFGNFHGTGPDADRMQAYITKVTALDATDGVDDGSGYLWPQNLTFVAEPARKIAIPDNLDPEADFIDGALFAEGDKDYLVIKKDGLTNQLYATSSVDSNSWQLVNDKITFGYEGPSVAKLSHAFYMVADHVTGATADGVHLFRTTDVTREGQWSQQPVSFVTSDGQACAARHGSVMVLPAGSPEWEVAQSLMGEVAKPPAPDPGLYYHTHVEDYGWQDWSADGAMAGTEGESKRLESMELKLEGMPYSGSIQYQTHIQNIGWESEWKSDGQPSGTEGQSLRLEAMRIRLTDQMAENYDVWYRVHAQNFGWLDWACNGEDAGTAGYGFRLEAMEVRLLPKGSDAPGSTEEPYVCSLVATRTHVQDVGWQDYVGAGQISGTSGQSLRLEGINLLLTNMPVDGSIQYRTHIQDIGWEEDWKADGAMSGTEGRSLRLEGIQIRLAGQMAEEYDVWYRVHAQDYGWLGWARNGESAGTEGHSLRLEGIIVRILPKGAMPDGDLTTTPFVAG